MLAGAAMVLAGYLWSNHARTLGPQHTVDATLSQAEQWEASALALLPTTEAAQRTRAVRRPKLLSEIEIAELLRAVEEMKPTAGRFARDAEGLVQLGSAP